MDNSWIDTEDYIYDSWKDKQVMQSYEHFESTRTSLDDIDMYKEEYL